MLKNLENLMENKEKEKIEEEFVKRCFDESNEEITLTGKQAKWCTNWWLAKIDSLLAEQKKYCDILIQEIVDAKNDEIRSLLSSK